METKAITSPVISRKEAAAYLGIAPGTLEVWASTKRYNLPFIKVGKRAMYRVRDLDQFLENNTVGTAVAK